MCNGSRGTQKSPPPPWVFQHPPEPSTQDGEANQGVLLGDRGVWGMVRDGSGGDWEGLMKQCTEFGIHLMVNKGVKGITYLDPSMLCMHFLTKHLLGLGLEQSFSNLSVDQDHLESLCTDN